MANSRAADNIGTLSVDIVGDLTKLDAALTEVEDKLKNVKTGATIKFDIPAAQITRLQKTVELIERLQKTGIPDLSGLSALGSAPAAGGRGSAASGKANVNVSFKEADLAKLFRTAAEAAFDTPISGVKLDLDMAHIEQQLAGLHVSFTADASGVTQAARAVPRSIPGLAEQLAKPEVQRQLSEAITGLNKWAKGTGQAPFTGHTAEEKFIAIASRLGNHANDIAQVTKSAAGNEVTGGAIHKLMQQNEQFADVLEEAGKAMANIATVTHAFDTYRKGGGPGPNGQPITQAPAPGLGQQQQTQLAQMRAAEAQTAAAHRQATMADGTRSAVPHSIDNINSFAIQLAKLSGYGSNRPGRSTIERELGQSRRVVAPLQGPTPTGLPIDLGGQAPNNDSIHPWRDISREVVAGRRSNGARGMRAFGRIATSQGTDITDLLMAAGPGARGLSGFGEVLKEGKPTGQYVSLRPEEQEYLKGETKRQGAVAGHPLVQLMPSRTMLERLLQATRGTSNEEAKEIAGWATQAGGPLNSRDLGPQRAATTGDMANLSSLMSSGGSTIENEARDQLRLRRLEEERRGFMTELAGTGVPGEQRSLRAKIANRSGQINRLQLINAGQGVSSEQNRQMIAEGFGAEKGELLGIDPLSRTGTRMADRSSIVTALTQLSQTAGEQQSFNEQIAQIREALLGGHLQGGEAPHVGNMTGIVGTGNQLFSSVRDLANAFREQVGLEPTRKTGLPSITKQLESQGFPVQAAGIQMLFGELGNLRSFAQPGRYEEVDSATGGKTQLFRAGSTFPERNKMREGTDIGVRQTQRRLRLQEQYDKAMREYVAAYGRGSQPGQVSAGAEHDPLAPGLPGGMSQLDADGLPTGESAKYRGAALIGEGRLVGQHTFVGQPVVGEIDKIKGRVTEAVNRSLGVKMVYGREEKLGTPSLPEGLSNTAYQAAIKDALEANPRYRELETQQADAKTRIDRLGRILTRHQPQAYFRQVDPETHRPTGLDMPTGDDERRRFYELSGMAPGGGYPISGAEIRKRRGFAMTQGSPALTVPGAASQMGPSILPPKEPPTDQGPRSPMGSGNVVHVWIDGPFPLAVKISGDNASSGRAKRIQKEMDAGNTAESQRLNVEEGVARGGTAESGGAVKAKGGKSSRINLDEMRAAEAAAGATQAGPALSARAQFRQAALQGRLLGAGGGQAFDFPIEVDPSGVAALKETPAQQAARRAAANQSAQAVARGARRPTRRELNLALARAGLSEDDLEDLAAPVNFKRTEDKFPSQAVLDAKQRARDAQARLPSRALGTSIVQLSQRVFGGRQGPEENIIRLQRLTGQLGQFENRGVGLRRDQAESYVNLLRARGAAQQIQGGQLIGRDAQGRLQFAPKTGAALPKELEDELQHLTTTYKEHTEAVAKNKTQVASVSDKIATLSKTAVTSSDVLRNLAAGFVGGIGGGLVTQGVSFAIQGVMMAAKVVEEAMKPAFEASIGYQNVTNKVIDSLSDQVRQNNGLTQSTVALKAAQSGLGYATYQSIKPQLEQASGIEAGNKAYGDYIDLVRAGENAGKNRGLYQTTGGFNALGVQTPFGGTPSTLENYLNQFQGAAFDTGTINGTQTSSDLFTNFFQSIKSIGSLPQLALAGATGNTDQFKQIIGNVTGAGIADRAVGNINSEFDKTKANYQAKREVGSVGNQAFVHALERQGVDEGKVQQVRGLGLEFTDRSGKIITDLDQLDGALRTWTDNLAKLDPKVWLEGQTGPTGGITSSIFALRQQSDLARQQALSQIALQRIAQPPVHLDDILSGMTGVPSQFTQAGPGVAPPSGIMNALQAQGSSAIQSQISAIGDPAAQQQAQQLLTVITAAGAAMHDLQVQAGKIQMAAMFRSMTHDITIANRSVSDLVGLTGKESATLQDGTKIQASDIGILERKNMLLSHTLQLQQFEHQQLALNYQIALAGFTAEGATGEERAARLEVAQKEAQYQKDQLKGQKELAGNNWQLQQKENDRAFSDAMYQSNELVRRLDDTAALQRIDDKISKWQEVSGAASGLLSTYLQQGSGMIQIAQGVSVQLLQMGVAAADAINMATAALSTANKTLLGITNPTGQTAIDPKKAIDTFFGHHDTSIHGTANVGPDNLPPQYFPPGIAPGQTYGPLQLLGQHQGHQVTIVNPSAGVDTQALVRVVMGELNRQAGLRGLTTVGGR